MSVPASTTGSTGSVAPGSVAPGSVALQRIGQVAIVVDDLARATRFYRDTLGLRLLFEAPPGLAFFDCGGVRLMLSREEGEAQGVGTSVLYYEVADIEAAYETLRTRDVHFEGEPHVVAPLGANDLWLAFLRDSERNLLALMSERPRPVNHAGPGETAR